VTIGAGCVLDHGFTLEATGTLSIGDRTVFGHHCTVAADDSVTIGAGCLLGELVSVRDHDHAFDRSDVGILDQGRTTAPVVIGDDVWVGAKATTRWSPTTCRPGAWPSECPPGSCGCATGVRCRAERLGTDRRGPV
jgi:UDP-3-O-[3-hydroxymyristoyl] glucosamine N-acyltransferase